MNKIKSKLKRLEKKAPPNEYEIFQVEIKALQGTRMGELYERAINAPSDDEFTVTEGEEQFIVSYLSGNHPLSEKVWVELDKKWPRRIWKPIFYDGWAKVFGFGSLKEFNQLSAAFDDLDDIDSARQKWEALAADRKAYYQQQAQRTFTERYER